MEYTMEELFPILGQLAEKYTAFESTSIPYETAEQLTEAVLYCICEAEQVQTNALVQAEGLSARQAYAIGAAAVEEKTRAALALYHETLQDFDSYGNRCLYDAFQQGLPEFFKWYDTKFMPQETMLTLDYPLLRDLSGQTGIDRIYSFIECIHLEQAFLNGFPEGTVKGILSRYNSQYGSLMENVCEIVLTTLATNNTAIKKRRCGVYTEILRRFYGTDSVPFRCIGKYYIPPEKRGRKRHAVQPPLIPAFA